jgi:hypothetical protein
VLDAADHGPHASVGQQPRRLSSNLPLDLPSDLASGPDRMPKVLQSRRTFAGFQLGSARDKVVKVRDLGGRAGRAGRRRGYPTKPE